MSIPNNYCHLHRQRRGGKYFTSQCALGSCSSLTFFIREVSAAQSLKKERGTILNVSKWVFFPMEKLCTDGKGWIENDGSSVLCLTVLQLGETRDKMSRDKLVQPMGPWAPFLFPLPFCLIYSALFTLSYLPQLGIQRLTKSSVGTCSNMLCVCSRGKKRKTFASKLK